MTPQDKRIIAQWRRRIKGRPRLVLSIAKDPRSMEFEAFCKALNRLVPELDIEREKGDSTPEIRISDNLHYRAVPLGPELGPFLKALQGVDTLAGDLTPAIRDRLSELGLPATLKIFISSRCPFCPHTVSRLLPLAGASCRVQLSVVDALLFNEEAMAARVRSVPATILDDQFRWTGLVEIEEIVKIMQNRDPSQLSAESLQKMLHDGEAHHIARMMIRNGEIFPPYLDLLTHKKWQTRLGAMVAFEYLVEERKELASRIIKPLWDNFPMAGQEIKGDILYILGESRDPKAIPLLEKVLSASYPEEIQEAAQEALEKIRGG